MGIGMTAYLTFLFSMQLPWAFRGDLDHMDSLKTLPLHPMVLAVGELAGGAVRAQGLAAQTMKAVKDIVGFVQR